ncbi:hypothetical protein PS662_03505 [Pseudomonas fluorescens]|uniref:Uncharacterized protein n=1 Tax=Pseudomonas fluorescens TaxID=294 RepID=A0A5E6UGI0_PSEFL|nr:hypothetical protein PS662_03505 [Pseudomonas fluorescens]
MNTTAGYSHQPWNKEKPVGQKAPLRVRDFWAGRVKRPLAENTRESRSMMPWKWRNKRKSDHSY